MDPVRKLRIPDSAGITGKDTRSYRKVTRSRDRIGVPGWAPILEGLPVGARGRSSRNLRSCLGTIDSEEPEGSNLCKSRNSGWHYPESNRDWTQVSRLRDFSSFF